MTKFRKKLITAILPKGHALELQKKLNEEKNLVTSNFNFARGMGKVSPLKYGGIGGHREKEVISVVVDEEISEDVFEFMFFEGEINKPHNGLIFMHSLYRSTDYDVPDDGLS